MSVKYKGKVTTIEHVTLKERIIMSEFGNDLVTLVDEDGVETVFEHLDSLEYNGVVYVALVPASEEPEDIIEATGELVVLKNVKDEDGEDVLVTIDDEEEYDNIVMAFEARLEDDFDFEEELEIDE